MAGLPATQPKYGPLQLKVLKGLRLGKTSGEIARELAPDKPRSQRYIRTVARQLAYKDEDLKIRAATAGLGALHEDMEPILEALARRAKRGNVPAIKLALEVTGIYSNVQKHEHSGDISISVNMPRPPREQDVIDGTVVE